MCEMCSNTGAHDPRCPMGMSEDDDANSMITNRMREHHRGKRDAMNGRSQKPKQSDAYNLGYEMGMRAAKPKKSDAVSAQ